MGLHNGCWAKVWEVKPGERNTILRVSVSRKNKEADEYIEDFTGYLKLVADAQGMAGEIVEGDRIKVGSCDVSTRYDKENKKSYVNYTVFSIEEISHKDGSSTPRASADSEPAEPQSDDEGELPF